MRGLAATLGIAPGQPFTPDQTLTAILDASVAVGEKYAATVALTPATTCGCGLTGTGPAT